jgi:hypothetical protein
LPEPAPGVRVECPHNGKREIHARRPHLGLSRGGRRSRCRGTLECQRAPAGVIDGRSRTEPGRRLRQRPLGIRRRSLRLLPRPDWTIRQAEARRRSVAVFAFWNVPTSELSQDKVDGIGLWKVSDLANALLSGVSPNGAHYYPSFPCPSYAKMTVADVRDLMAYLRTPPCYSASGALSDSGRSCISIANRLITIRAAETPGTVGSILSKH